MTRARGALALTILLLLTAATGAADVSVSFGFEGQYKPGRWTPVRVSVSDRVTRAVDLALYLPHSRTTAMRLGQQLMIGPTERTFTFYAPLQYSVADFRAELRDAGTGKLVAEFPARQDRPIWSGQPAGVDRLIVCSGADFRLGGPIELEAPRSGPRQEAAVSNVRAVELPAAVVGYEGVETLVLAGLGPTTLDPQQQEAIVAWVKAGGQLIVWPGDQPPDASSALATVLPGTFDAPQTVTLTADQLAAARLPARFADLSVRRITPSAGARSESLFGSEGIQSVTGRVGLGRVLLLPFNASTLQFQASAGPAFWRDLILRGFPADSSGSLEGVDFNFGYAYGESRREAGLTGALDAIGKIPGTGTFGFGYVAVMLGAMMFVVGPVDWFVLKKLGRQPWTWLTTTGWIGLITCGAVFAGHLLRSGELHFRTLSVVDEIDGQAVARTDALLLYAPKSATYDVQTPPTSWWQPFGTASRYGSATSVAPVTVEQDARGNRPAPMYVDVWSYRFLQGTATDPGRASIQADLSRGADGAIVGTIRNTNGTACGDLLVRTRDKLLFLTAPVPADGTAVDVAGKWRAIEGFDPYLQGNRMALQYPPYSVQDSDQKARAALAAEPFSSLGGLSFDRARLLDRLLREDPDTVVIYATFNTATPPASVNDPTAKVEHRQLVRAVVRLQGR